MVPLDHATEAPRSAARLRLIASVTSRAGRTVRVLPPALRRAVRQAHEDDRNAIEAETAAPQQPVAGNIAGRRDPHRQRRDESAAIADLDQLDPHAYLRE